jgi:dihydrofolate synthase / folylpolyglutamate synthase
VPYVPPVSPASADYLARGDRRPVQRYPLQVMDREILVETPLLGRHQLRNVALAIAAAIELSKQGFKVTAESIERGIRSTHWPGRFEVRRFAANGPDYVFDVAHNPAGVWALRSALSAVYGDRRLFIVFGVLRDKAMREMTEVLFPLAERIIATHADNPRSASAAEIREAAARVSTEIEDAPDITAALRRAGELATREDVVLVTGSIYVVGEAMRILEVEI